MSSHSRPPPGGLVLLLTLAAAISGAWSITKLPIDAVPDVTNVQVQINAVAPALSPIEVEKQVTFPIENGARRHAGARVHPLVLLPQTASSQVTAVFHRQDRHLLRRQQVSERITEARSNLPPGVELRIGADLDRSRRGLLVGRSNTSHPAPAWRRAMAGRAGKATARISPTRGRAT